MISTCEEWQHLLENYGITPKVHFLTMYGIACPDFEDVCLYLIKQYKVSILLISKPTEAMLSLHKMIWEV